MRIDMKKQRIRKSGDEIGGALVWQRAFEAAAKARLLADLATVRDEVHRLEQACSSIPEDPHETFSHTRRGSFLN